MVSVFRQTYTCQWAFADRVVPPVSCCTESLIRNILSLSLPKVNHTELRHFITHGVEVLIPNRTFNGQLCHILLLCACQHVRKITSVFHDHCNLGHQTEGNFKLSIRIDILNSQIPFCVQLTYYRLSVEFHDIHCAVLFGLNCKHCILTLRQQDWCLRQQGCVLVFNNTAFACADIIGCEIARCTSSTEGDSQCCIRSDGRCNVCWSAILNNALLSIETDCTDNIAVNRFQCKVQRSKTINSKRLVCWINQWTKFHLTVTCNLQLQIELVGSKGYSKFTTELITVKSKLIVGKWNIDTVQCDCICMPACIRDNIERSSTPLWEEHGLTNQCLCVSTYPTLLANSYLHTIFLHFCKLKPARSVSISFNRSDRYIECTLVKINIS